MKLTLFLLVVPLAEHTFTAVVIRDDSVQVHILETECRSYDDSHVHNGIFDITFFHANDVYAHLNRFRASGANCTGLTLGCSVGIPVSRPRWIT